jgi:hypothetical protein
MTSFLQLVSEKKLPFLVSIPNKHSAFLMTVVRFFMNQTLLVDLLLHVKQYTAQLRFIKVIELMHFFFSLIVFHIRIVMLVSK